MKKVNFCYYVGVNTGAGVVQIVKVRDRDMASPENPYGIRYATMFADPYYSLMYMSTSKKRCMQYIKENYSDFEIYDCSSYWYQIPIIRGSSIKFKDRGA